MNPKFVRRESFVCLSSLSSFPACTGRDPRPRLCVFLALSHVCLKKELIGPFAFDVFSFSLSLLQATPVVLSFHPLLARHKSHDHPPPPLSPRNRHQSQNNNVEEIHRSSGMMMARAKVDSGGDFLSSAVRCCNGSEEERGVLSVKGVEI